ncbi:hypothetical protein ABPG72_008822 [Tetrahymena utriculariae]
MLRHTVAIHAIKVYHFFQILIVYVGNVYQISLLIKKQTLVKIATSVVHLVQKKFSFKSCVNNLAISNQSQLYKCQKNEFLDTFNTCQPCNSSCQSCNRKLVKNCLSCKSPFLLQQDSSCGDCSMKSYAILNGQCLYCPQSQGYFLYQNSSCKYCYGLEGFKLNKTSGFCEEDCGKGFINQINLTYYAFARSIIQCDDGNLIIGDGCSLACQIEQGFNCTQSKNKNNQSYKSICQKINIRAIPSLLISQDVTKIGDTYLIKAIIQFDHQVKISDQSDWQIQVYNQFNNTFQNQTYQIVPIKNQLQILQNQYFQIVIRTNQDFAKMKIQLVITKDSDVVDKNKAALSSAEKGQAFQQFANYQKYKLISSYKVQLLQY